MVRQWLWETSGLSPYSALSLGREWIHVGFSLRGVWKNFTRFLREGRRRPFRSAEADPPWSCFLTDHRDFPVAVRYQVVDALVVHVVLDMPAVVPHRCPGPASQKAVGFRCCSSSATTGAGLDVQTTAELEPVGDSKVSWTRLCSCAQPVETSQAHFFSFWGPVHRYRAGGPCHEDRGRVAQTPGSSYTPVHTTTTTTTTRRFHPSVASFLRSLCVKLNAGDS